MKLSGISKILYIPLSKVSEVWSSLSPVSPFRPVKAQRCRGSSGTNRSESYYIESCSRRLSGDESGAKSCECRLLCRQQSGLFQPAWMVDAWLFSSGQRCSTSFQWRRQKGALCGQKWGHTHKKNKIKKSGWAVAAGLYFKIPFQWRGRLVLIDEMLSLWPGA